MFSYVQITVDAAYEDDDQVKMDENLQSFFSDIGDPSKGNLKPFRYFLLAQFSMLHFQPPNSLRCPFYLVAACACLSATLTLRFIVS